ncbi:unnamed protein product [Cylicocyclus nassatus]|uniref:Uncharacterized protein n=1 Tax=Cylicocyclus nassatus TaxID=53992 RepID=A0AA36GJQ9_CYLNA|nr:unnamed protein product [Cylicocyclus nassatus]
MPDFDGLSSGAVASYIIILGFVVVIAVALLAFFILNKRKGRQRQRTAAQNLTRNQLAERSSPTSSLGDEAPTIVTIIQPSTLPCNGQIQGRRYVEEHYIFPT